MPRCGDLAIFVTTTTLLQTECLPIAHARGVTTATFTRHAPPPPLHMSHAFFQSENGWDSYFRLGLSYRSKLPEQKEMNIVTTICQLWSCVINPLGNLYCYECKINASRRGGGVPTISITYAFILLIHTIQWAAGELATIKDENIPDLVSCLFAR